MDLYSLREGLEAIAKAAHVADAVKSLFCEVLLWGQPQGSPRLLQLGAPVSRQVTAIPVAQMSGLPVYLVEWSEQRLPGVTARRAVQRALAPVSAEHVVCYITKDRRQLAFTWARRRTDGKTELRTLPYEFGSPARTTIERLAELKFSLDELSKGPIGIMTVTGRLNEAFSVETVTERFFEDYRRVFADLQQRLYKQFWDQTWAHDYALQLLNRLMFLYFIQRKGWLGNNPRFLYHFWQSYKASGQPRDSFFTQWLQVLFFEAFNREFHGGYRQFPEDIRNALQMAPYLNGGLFRKNRLDTDHSVDLPDDFFVTLFDTFEGSTPGFLERYNFTIAESTPLDVEVAVDPEMIGKVYESLVNITTEGLTEVDLRGMAGIFYTPRVEIDLMCRLALVDALTNRLGEEHKSLLYDFVFATEPAEKEEVDRAIAEHDLWPRLNAVLRELTVCDPACGSGSFLVGMLLVLDDLQARANLQLGIEETPYERRRRIIGEQLYGVDVMDWAVHVAELRLWLQLVVETEFRYGETLMRPLLPNLSFKIRRGDSLVQEIAGLNFGLKRHQLEIPRSLKGKITQLKGKKLRFYQGEQGLDEFALRQEEIQIFRAILDYAIDQKQKELIPLNLELKKLEVQPEFANMGKASSASEQRRSWEAQIAEVQAEIDRYRNAQAALRTVQDVPFVWDIAFVEIFEGEAGGFDIVIGNPPYVRQERIAPPEASEEKYAPEAWRRLKAEYKEKLQRSVAMAWPKFFRYNVADGKFRKPDGKSDLYVYFYFHGLSLLNEHGSFCFITSNSWLDVGYGADLQEFLLRYGHIKLILDNEKKRSFAQADVNTVIALLGPADKRHEEGLTKTARFVMFKAPFEEIANAETFKAIEAVTDRLVTNTFRVTARRQQELLEEALVSDDEDDETGTGSSQRARARSPLIKTTRYVANKWGGKYLRAPDIFYTILEKGRGKLVRLGDIAEVRFGIKTGANEFFYLEPTGKSAAAGYLHVRNGAGWEGEIEEAFLKPVIKSPREVRTIVIRPEDLRYKIFMCHEDKAALKGTAALEYIEWGETQGYHERPSCRGRPRWWDVGVRSKAAVNVNYLIDDIMRFFVKEDGFFVSDNFQEVHCRYDLSWQTAAAANSTVFQLFANIVGRANFGGGLMKIQTYEVETLWSVNPDLLDKERSKKVLSNADRLDLDCRDRRALDDVVFDALGLTPGEREAVYEAVVELVRARLEKAKSLQGRSPDSAE